MTDGWIFIAITFAKKTCRDLQKYQTTWFCKSCIRKEIPFSSLNDRELALLSNGMSFLPNRKEKLPKTILEKLNAFTENEDMKCK